MKAVPNRGLELVLQKPGSHALERITARMPWGGFVFMMNARRSVLDDADFVTRTIARLLPSLPLAALPPRGLWYPYIYIYTYIEGAQWACFA